MIKAEVNKEEVHIKEVEGNALTIMSELCCLVKAVCMGWCEDEKDSEKMTSQMVSAVADALGYHESLLRATKLEDDENADF